jgi:ribose transport system substrate-binding protein
MSELVLKAKIDSACPIQGIAERYDGHKVEGISIGQPPFLSVVSLGLARRILNNEYQRKDITIPFPSVTSETVKVGETVFPKLRGSFFDDFTDAGANAIVALCPQVALDGNSCGGTLKVTLPATA